MKGVLLLGQMLPLLNPRRKTPEVDEFKSVTKKITRIHHWQQWPMLAHLAALVTHHHHLQLLVPRMTMTQRLGRHGRPRSDPLVQPVPR